ncbi:uncharacterized protein LOC133191297 [Saccostrea echinata]|uniref:uncharacterized protein LOC133191297 n=1 Tax=Saccostrea echinata TaxID=191078 RepID=UPI002A81EFE6|nr:uncharacterized protein LOC133191297 [Saccostrea echinata]
MAAKKRSENFSTDDVLFIISKVEENIDVIQSKQTNQITNAKKAGVWKSITDAVNARGGVNRTVEQVKEKYRKACSKAKGDNVTQKIHRRKTGGGPPHPPLDAISQKILDLHEDSPNFTGFQGGIEVGGFNVTEKSVPKPEDSDCVNECLESQISCNTSSCNTYNGCGLETLASNGESQQIIELPENSSGSPVAFNVTISNSGTTVRKSDCSAEEKRKRKPIETGSSELQLKVSDLQRRVLLEDLERIKEQRELIKLQKTKVDLEIKKLKMDIANHEPSNINEP